MKRVFVKFILVLAIVIACNGSITAATVVIENGDAAGVGFNDTSPRDPIGGNTGTTLGQQRMIAFQYAANIWGGTLTSNITIVIRANWAPLTCTTNSAVLAQAGPHLVSRNFTGALYTDTYYPIALANRLQNTDRVPGVQDINATVNINLGNADCFSGAPFYLGLDNPRGAPPQGNQVDLVTTLLHEFAHGLGFITMTDGSTGSYLVGSNGVASPTIFDRFLVDDATGLSWLQMSNAQRAASAMNGQLAWNGPSVVSNAASVLTAGKDAFNKPFMHSPNPFQGGSSVSHWSTLATPNQLMEPAINRDLTHNVAPPFDLTFPQLSDIGWVPTAMPSSIITSGGDGQRAGVNSTFFAPLVATVNPPLAGIQVTWTINSGEAATGSFITTGTRFAVSFTNASGVAEAPPIIAEGRSGTFTVNATAPGAGTTTFTLRTVTPTRR